MGVGHGVVVYPLADLDAVPDRQPEDIDLEIVSFVEALANARDDIRSLSKRMASHLPPAEKALFDVYLRILEDNSLGKEVISEIAPATGHKARYAVWFTAMCNNLSAWMMAIYANGQMTLPT